MGNGKKYPGETFRREPSIRSNDEIAALAGAFNNMAGNMQALVDKVKEDERKMRKADLRLLQEQINPHFLYNTLDTIVWLIEAEETDKAVNMVVTLSDFFRLVLSKGREFITIREEEQHISSYLEIQEVRYHDIMEYEVQIDKSLYEFEIPKLTLQPLVENALYHGIKYKRAKGYIHVHGERTERLSVLPCRTTESAWMRRSLWSSGKKYPAPARKRKRDLASPMSTSAFACTSAQSTE